MQPDCVLHPVRFYRPTLSQAMNGRRVAVSVHPGAGRALTNRWSPGPLVVAHLRKDETYAELLPDSRSAPRPSTAACGRRSSCSRRWRDPGPVDRGRARTGPPARQDPTTLQPHGSHLPQRARAHQRHLMMHNLSTLEKKVSTGPRTRPMKPLQSGHVPATSLFGQSLPPYSFNTVRSPAFRCIPACPTHACG